MPWLASILLDVAVEDDVVQDLAHVVFIISKNSYNTNPMVILHFSMLSPFWLKPTVLIKLQQCYFGICTNLHDKRYRVIGPQ